MWDYQNHVQGLKVPYRPSFIKIANGRAKNPKIRFDLSWNAPSVHMSYSLIRYITLSRSVVGFLPVPCRCGRAGSMIPSSSSADDQRPPSLQHHRPEFLSHTLSPLTHPAPQLHLQTMHSTTVYGTPQHLRLRNTAQRLSPRPTHPPPGSGWRRNYRWPPHELPALNADWWRRWTLIGGDGGPALTLPPTVRQLFRPERRQWGGGGGAVAR